MAREAGLRYVSDTIAGITRTRRRTEFSYLTAGGRRVRNGSTLRRIAQLAIPPAWSRVWICPFANGHIQATGRDARRRKQYRYHDEWRTARDATKFDRMVAFGRVLPRIRRRVARDLRRPGVGREKVIAAIVALLERTHIRIGNEEYAIQNHAFGLTTLQDRHVNIVGGRLHFHFRGKGGKEHDISLRAPRLAQVVHAAQELPGQQLFQYRDETGKRQSIDSADVNAYLHAVAGENFSAKDFRTWSATILASRALHQDVGVAEAPTKRLLNEAIKAVAGRLGNTPAICRKCYIHPAIIESYFAGNGPRYGTTSLRRSSRRRHGVSLANEERTLLRFLRKVGAPGDGKNGTL